MLKYYLWAIFLVFVFIDKVRTEKRILQIGDNCTSDTDCGNGKCINQTKCQCDKGYTNFDDKQNPKKQYCNYEKKKQIKAFLLELCVGFGAGNFYLERTLHAVLKLIAFIFGLYLICLFPLTAKFINNKFDSELLVLLVSCIYYCCSAGLAFWYIYDLVNIGMNRYNDGNNIPLLEW